MDDFGGLNDENQYQIYFNSAREGYDASVENAKTYANYRMDGYGKWQALVMSGLAECVDFDWLA